MKLVAFLISSLIGFVIGHYLLPGAAGAYASILISYHVYLAFLVVTGNHQKGISMPIGLTILMHLAFLAILIGIPYLRQQIPFFGFMRLFVPALAPFEAMWLFSGNGGKPAPRAAAPAPPLATEPTINDHEAFRRYLMQGDREFRKLGLSIDDEFKLWFAKRSSR